MVIVVYDDLQPVSAANERLLRPLERVGERESERELSSTMEPNRQEKKKLYGKSRVWVL